MARAGPARRDRPRRRRPVAAARLRGVRRPRHRRVARVAVAEVFADTLLFPLAVAVLGLGIMVFGIALARYGKAWRQTSMPASRAPYSAWFHRRRQRALERVGELWHVALVEGQRRADLEHVAVRPGGPTSTPSWRIASRTLRAPSVDELDPQARPTPRTSPISGRPSATSVSAARSARPVRWTRSRMRSSSMTSSTASAAAALTGLPPNVLNTVVCPTSWETMSLRVMTAATGCRCPWACRA